MTAPGPTGVCACGEVVFTWCNPHWCGDPACRQTVIDAHVPSGLPVPPADWCKGPDQLPDRRPWSPPPRTRPALIPLPDGWVSPTGNPDLREDVLATFPRAPEPTPLPTLLDPSRVMPRPGWLAPIVARLTGEAT